ncbi:MAG: AAA family ATPase [Candidatus Melainabacteria bacterium]|nr:AAA family ATPase [Candidatus Melainabacteria bacterium]
MRRKIELELEQWSKAKQRKPLIIRGARQVGKSYIIRDFAKKNFSNLVEINFERKPELKDIFDSNDPQKIINAIQITLSQKIISSQTLLFLDEIQQCPQAIVALRYFYEEMPELHVISAGSLLDFTLESEQISVPVGRVQYMYLYPMSFYEYLEAVGKVSLVEWIQTLSLEDEYQASIDLAINEELKQYFYLGGMPEIIYAYINQVNITELLNLQDSLLVSYKDDFGKYAKRAQAKYLEEVLQGLPKLVSQKFVYSKINPDTKSLNIRDALDLLVKAKVVHKIKRANGTGLPFEAGASDKHFKAIMLDIGLMQNILGLSEDIMLSKDLHSIAAGALTEQFVGQELLATASSLQDQKLFYWEREDKSNAAEIDYLISVGSKQIPVEVKSSHRGRLKSLRYFMDNFDCPLGLRISTNRLGFEDGILSVPLYAVAEIPRLVKAL